MPPNQGISQNNHDMLERRLAQTKEREHLFVWPSLLFLGSLLNLLEGLKKWHPCYQCSVIIPSGVKPLSEKVPFPLSNRNTWEKCTFSFKFPFLSIFYPLRIIFFFLFQCTRCYPDILEHNGNPRWYLHFPQSLTYLPSDPLQKACLIGVLNN